MPRVVCITQLAAPTERVIGPFPPDAAGPMGNGGESHKWITDHLSDEWIRIADMPLEVPESDCCPLCGTPKGETR